MWRKIEAYILKLTLRWQTRALLRQAKLKQTVTCNSPMLDFYSEEWKLDYLDQLGLIPIGVVNGINTLFVIDESLEDDQVIIEPINKINLDVQIF